MCKRSARPNGEVCLQFAAFTLSVVWGLGIYVASRLAWSHAENGHKVGRLPCTLFSAPRCSIVLFMSGALPVLRAATAQSCTRTPLSRAAVVDAYCCRFRVTSNLGVGGRACMVVWVPCQPFGTGS